MMGPDWLSLGLVSKIFFVGFCDRYDKESFFHIVLHFSVIIMAVVFVGYQVSLRRNAAAQRVFFMQTWLLIIRFLDSWSPPPRGHINNNVYMYCCNPSDGFPKDSFSRLVVIKQYILRRGTHQYHYHIMPFLVPNIPMLWLYNRLVEICCNKLLLDYMKVFLETKICTTW